ncbi:uncharacterized protein P174DRAFT_419359 [Aspergillus novofumigatus IBT 16806]|uniref:Uncharacterized protein n=1 Tax=Aspergillus novofumigatus (strain IBT 16806) TaxID=1392255 RepID=A0A2I1CCS0_ASPN1|nr:uncharacterized protein P174DRAFT_419359 [Aspergillus novofumigatus IBT 16806]PKX95420.1 hypothetical protein P174DRAFT_419359 [Aspergillus novofumigatus IBT 16806]
MTILPSPDPLVLGVVKITAIMPPKTVPVTGDDISPVASDPHHPYISHRPLLEGYSLPLIVLASGAGSRLAQVATAN